MSEMNESASSSRAPCAVLTNRSLYLLVTSFMDGLPFFAIAFARQHGSASSNYIRQQPGLLPRLAVDANDYVMLKRLYRLHEQLASRTPAWSQLNHRLTFDHAMTHAAERRNLNALEWLHEHTTVSCLPKTLAFAATLGHFEVVKWLAENRKDGCASIGWTPCDAMVLPGNIDLVKFMTKTFPQLVLTTDAMDNAIAQGHLPIVEYLSETRDEGCTVDAMNHAARCGRLDIVKFLHDNRPEGCTELAMDFAAANGHLEVVQFLHSHRTEGCTMNAMDEAAQNGHIQVVEFLHFNRTEGCSTFAIDMAAWQGHLSVLRFLHTHRSEGFTPMAIGQAARFGHLQVIQFLHESQMGETNCDEDALQEAARFGHLGVVQYLVENCTKGCVFMARQNAAQSNRKEIVDYLAQHIRDDVKSCSINNHRLEDRHRPCQGYDTGPSTCINATRPQQP